MNPYKVLNLQNNAPIPEVKKRFRKLTLKLHPDVGGDEETFIKILEAYNKILDGYRIHTPIVQKPKNTNITYADVVLTLDDGFCGCEQEIYLNDNIAKIYIPPGILPNQTIMYEGLGERDVNGVRGYLCVTVKFNLPNGFSFEKYMSKTVLVYNVKFKNIPENLTVTVNGKTKKIKMPSKIYDGMFLKIKDFGYVNDNKPNPLYIRIGVRHSASS